ncbi:MAG: hypothetical protein BWX71_02550 [Deltaproteobacteria bacterium ADurb.Bin072]|nr:MAG: hypothetical protein BWX71_02550 [Deltaproteobacteria bacterium ADurb.Bin072]
MSLSVRFPRAPATMRHRVALSRPESPAVFQKMSRMAPQATMVINPKNGILYASGRPWSMPKAAPVLRAWMMSKNPGITVNPLPMSIRVWTSHLVHWSMT